MKVKRDEAVKLFNALDYHTAKDWSNERMAEKLGGLGKVVDEETEVENGLKPLLKKVLEAGAEIEVDGDEPEVINKAAPKRVAKKAAKASDKASEKSNKKNEKAKTSTKRGESACSVIISCLRKGSAKSPATKAEMLTVLKKKFTDRKESSMKHMINNLMSELHTKRGLTVKSNDNGWWIPS
jgi:hypothetical protein